MKQYLKYLLYDMTALKSILFVWGPILALVAASRWINKLDPSYNWKDIDPLYWGDKMVLVAALLALLALFVFAIRARIRQSKKGKPAKDS